MSAIRRPHFAWLVFAAACVISFVGFGLTVNTASIYWGPVSAELGVDLASVSLMSTASGLAGAIALGVAAPLFERLNLRLFLTAMVVLTAIAYFVSAGAPNVFVLYGANLVMGVTKAVAVMLSVPILLGNWFEKRLGLVTGIAGAMTAVGGSIFSPLIGAIITEQGWRSAYVFTGIVMLVALLPFTMFVAKLRPTGDQRPYGYDPERETTSASVALSGVSFRRAVRSLPFFAFLIAGILFQFAGSLVQHVPTYLTTSGVALTTAAGIFSLLLLGASVGKFAIGAALDQLKPIVAIAIFTVIAIFGWGGLFLFSDQLPLSVASFASGMGQAINLTAVVVLVRNAFGAAEYSKILGPLLMAGSLANAGGVYVHGLLVTESGGYGISFVGNVVIFAVCFALLVAALRSSRRLPRDVVTAPSETSIADDDSIAPEPDAAAAEVSR